MAHPLFIQNGLLAIADGAWFMEFRFVLLTGFALVAAINDLRQRRIPNKLILCGLLTAFSWSFFYPYDLGWQQSLLGALTGIGLLLPFFLLRGMAAGDVKLMGLVGAFLGPKGCLLVTLFTFLVGGGWVLAWLTIKRAWPQVLTNLWVLWQTVGIARAPVLDDGGDGLKSVGSIPYGVAIAAGVLLLVGLIKQGLIWI